MTEVEAILATLVERVPAATFAAVGGMDGLLVEHVPEDRPDLPEVVAELTTMLGIARRTAGDILDAGALTHVAIDARDASLTVWIVSEDFYCLVGSERPVDVRAVREAAQEAVDGIREALT